MLVALGVIALMAGIALIALPGPERHVQAAAERFAAYVARGGEDSVMANRALALRLTPEGYGFEARSPTGWAPLPPGGPLSFRRWPQGVSAAVEEGFAPGQTQGHLTIYDVLGAASPATVRLSGAAQDWRVRVEPSGQVHVAPVS
jgi:general secretion pathway protein H